MSTTSPNDEGKPTVEPENESRRIGDFPQDPKIDQLIDRGEEVRAMQAMIHAESAQLEADLALVEAGLHQLEIGEAELCRLVERGAELKAKRPELDARYAQTWAERDEIRSELTVRLQRYKRAVSRFWSGQGRHQ